MKFSRFSAPGLGLLVGMLAVNACGDDPAGSGAEACEDDSCAGAESGGTKTTSGGATGTGGTKAQPSGGEAGTGGVAAGGDTAIGGDTALGGASAAGGEAAGAGAGAGSSEAGQGGGAPVGIATGEPCDEESEVCESGHCIDGVCCNSACEGTCDSCRAENTDGAEGACLPVKLGGDPDHDCGSYRCAGEVAQCSTSCLSTSDCGSSAFCFQNECVKGKRIFMTSTTYAATFDTLATADTACQTRANVAGLIGTFKAWISNSTTNMLTRSTHSEEPYYRKESGEVTVIANDWNDLIDGVFVAVATDEFGAVRGYELAFTGTEYNGTVTANNCNNWGSASAQLTFGTGHSSAGGGALVGQNWSHYQDNPCNEQAHLFCIEQ